MDDRLVLLGGRIYASSQDGVKEALKRQSWHSGQPSHQRPKLHQLQKG